ncbi:unnamed protein product [Rotaria sordida]|uniref:Uncharacterized protein n=1 Tax=Rotaria sordida TaxID=392033 RepID=A0A814WGK7_9BILA|nr:unnamed protein product [Rotaria sordida]
MLQLARLTGHTFRVLYLAVSPDGESIVTGAGDETLRFWNDPTFQRFHWTGKTYRGMIITEFELQLYNRVGNGIVNHAFLSTSKDREVALSFASSPSPGNPIEVELQEENMQEAMNEMGYLGFTDALTKDY